jgi:hypothetical protein
LVSRAVSIVAAIVVLGAARSAGAQPPPVPCHSSSDATRALQYSPFADPPWYEPLAANPRDARSELLVWGLSRRFPFMTGKPNLPVWDLSFGKELAIAAWETDLDPRAFMNCRGWGLGVWMPLSFHMVDALTEDSSPIINHDYRFAAALKLAHAASPRDLLSIKVQIGHESTHLGDEFAIRAMRTFGGEFQRVNVSYEYVEFGLNWRRQFGRSLDHALSVRASGVRAVDVGRGHGWYSTELLDGRVIPASRVNFEPAIGAEYVAAEASGWRPFVSYEGRLRTVYDYGRASASQREDRQFSSSLILGATNRAWSRHGMPILIARGYYGVNPHGQFRSQAGYWMLGIGLLIRL